MRPPKQKQPQVKKGLCRVLEHVDVDVDAVFLIFKSRNQYYMYDFVKKHYRGEVVTRFFRVGEIRTAGTLIVRTRSHLSCLSNSNDLLIVILR